MKANISLFQRYKDRTANVLAVGGLLLLPIGLWLALVASPQDYLQKETVRIMYVHVPAAWLGTSLYALMALCGVGYMIGRNLLLLLVSKATAAVGLTFTLICMGTGSLWGKPMWGAWWVWDARLTSVAILALLYGGYMVTLRLFDDEDEGLRVGAILLMIGLINLPIIKWSVTWWHTLHQPASVFRVGGPTIHASMLTPLSVMAVVFACGAGWLIIRRTENELLRRQVRLAQHLDRRRALYQTDERAHDHAA